MGLGKSLCAMASHALEAHTLPEEPEMHSAHSAAELQQEVATVFVGKRHPGEPEKEKLKEAVVTRGFRQQEELDWPVVPDGSVRASTSCFTCV